MDIASLASHLAPYSLASRLALFLIGWLIETHIVQGWFYAGGSTAYMYPTGDRAASCNAGYACVLSTESSDAPGHMQRPADVSASVPCADPHLRPSGHFFPRCPALEFAPYADLNQSHHIPDRLRSCPHGTHHGHLRPCTTTLILSRALVHHDRPRHRASSTRQHGVPLVWPIRLTNHRCPGLQMRQEVRQHT